MTGATLTAHVEATPEAVFAVLTDPGRLPAWNTTIRKVIAAPTALSEGAEWVVEMHAMGQTWRSRSRVLELDPSAGVFRHRSRTDDGNPSFAEWSWAVRPDGDSAEVTVSWTLNPKTFWRRLLFVKIRQRQLVRRELPSSLRALAKVADPALVHD